MERASGITQSRTFKDIAEYFRPGDVLVLNNSRVIPARLRGENARTGGKFEVLLLEENAVNDWWVMLRPGKRARVNTQIVLRDLRGKVTPIVGTVQDTNAEGHRRLRFEGMPDLKEALDEVGETPLPPYIARTAPNYRANDRQRYQTVYARVSGSVAASSARWRGGAGTSSASRSGSGS